MAAAVGVMLLPRGSATKPLGYPEEYPIGSVTRLAFDGQILPADPRKMPSNHIVVWLVHDANPVDMYQVLFAADSHSGCIVG
jgi:hypothetical protein